MRLRIRDTGVVVTPDELRAMRPSEPLPAVLTPELIDALGVDPVFEGPQPTATQDQYVVSDGVIEENGKWFTHYVVKDYTPEELAARHAQWFSTAKVDALEARLRLLRMGKMDAVEKIFMNPNTPKHLILAFEYADEWARDSELVEAMAPAFAATGSRLGKYDGHGLDDIFKADATHNPAAKPAPAKTTV